MTYRTATNPAGHTCWFDADSHRYRIAETGEELTAVSSFVHSFVKPFDSRRHAERVASRRGITADYVLAEWGAKRDEAATLGTRTHQNLEDWIHDRPHRNAPRHDHERAVFRTAWEALRAVQAKYRLLEAEKMVFCADLDLAGTIDAVAFDSATGDLWILDWKTNAEIKAEGYDRMLPPLDSMTDCNLIRYGLQLATYEMILRHGGYVRPGQVIGRALVHLRPEGPEWLSLPDLTVHVGAMIASVRANGYSDIPF